VRVDLRVPAAPAGAPRPPRWTRPIAHAEDPESEPTLVEKLLVGKGSHLALAIFCSKAFVPIKLPLAVALTPYVHR
jgi:hypothetical protein